MSIVNAATQIGPLALPVTVGATQAPVDDPVVTGLMHYLAFWLQYVLGPKLATMTNPPVADACPTANRFAWNPQAQVNDWNYPAIFTWWEGAATQEPWTICKIRRVRQIDVIYAFPWTLGERRLSDWRGLMGAVDGAFQVAVKRGAHPLYGANGYAPNTQIRQILDIDVLDYLGQGGEMYLSQVPSRSIREAAKTSTKNREVGAVNQGFPAFRAAFRVKELIGWDTLDLPSDNTGDINVAINVSPTGQTIDGVPALDHVLPHYDGSST